MKTWKIQKFFSDVVYDLRSRGLLPLAALLLVAMIVLPVLISRMSSDSAPVTSVTATESAAELAPENQAAVLAYSPGVRNYRKRLNDLTALFCATCHDRQTSGRHVMAAFSAADTHPVKGKPDPSRSGRELSCTSCHNPHSNESPDILSNPNNSL